MKKCPPGVICLENVTIFFIVFIMFVVGYLIYKNMERNKEGKEQRNPNIIVVNQKPSYPYNNLPNDVLRNPYDPPMKDERYMVDELSVGIGGGRVPINVSTNAVDTTYRQLGILTPLNGTSKDNILPLMGKPLFTRRSLWNYYTISNQHNNVKLPVSLRGKSGLSEYGVDEVFSGDTVYVEGYNDAFKVTVYENSVMKYLPFV
jgi:hypothetical protein